MRFRADGSVAVVHFLLLNRKGMRGKDYFQGSRIRTVRIAAQLCSSRASRGDSCGLHANAGGGCTSAIFNRERRERYRDATHATLARAVHRLGERPNAIRNARMPWPLSERRSRKAMFGPGSTRTSPARRTPTKSRPSWMFFAADRSRFCATNCPTCGGPRKPRPAATSDPRAPMTNWGSYSLDWDNRHDERLLPGITTALLRPVERPNQRGQIGVRDPRLETETRYRTSIELSEERGVLCVSVVLL